MWKYFHSKFGKSQRLSATVLKIAKQCQIAYQDCSCYKEGIFNANIISRITLQVRNISIFVICYVN